MESIKMDQEESTALNLTVDPRVYIRDTYCSMFHKGAALAYIAMQDYDTGFKTYGRIEIIEFLAWGLWVIENFIFKDAEEKRYYDWLRTLKSQ